MITRCYLEITNICNLNCVFCPKTTRAKHMLTLDEFDTLTTHLQGKVKFLYFHHTIIFNKDGKILAFSYKNELSINDGDIISLQNYEKKRKDNSKTIR